MCGDDDLRSLGSIQVHRSAWRKITAKISTAKTTTKMIIMISVDIREVSPHLTKQKKGPDYRIQWSA